MFSVELSSPKSRSMTSRLRLLEISEERNKFLQHMSHELKTPLASIREGTELLMDGAVGELDSAQREVTTILRDNGIKLQQLLGIWVGPGGERPHVADPLGEPGEPLPRRSRDALEAGEHRLHTFLRVLSLCVRPLPGQIEQDRLLLDERVV